MLFHSTVYPAMIVPSLSRTGKKRLCLVEEKNEITIVELSQRAHRICTFCTCFVVQLHCTDISCGINYSYVFSPSLWTKLCPHRVWKIVFTSRRLEIGGKLPSFMVSVMSYNLDQWSSKCGSWSTDSGARGFIFYTEEICIMLCTRFAFTNWNGNVHGIFSCFA